MMIRKARVALVLSSCVTGCFSRPAVLDGHAYLAQTLAPKAAFDLQCDATQLQFANLGPAERIRVADPGRPGGEHEALDPTSRSNRV
jgi:hypothetical protein